MDALDDVLANIVAVQSAHNLIVINQLLKENEELIEKIGGLESLESVVKNTAALHLVDEVEAFLDGAQGAESNNNLQECGFGDCRNALDQNIDRSGLDGLGLVERSESSNNESSQIHNLVVGRILVIDLHKGLEAIHRDKGLVDRHISKQFGENIEDIQHVLLEAKEGIHRTLKNRGAIVLSDHSVAVVNVNDLSKDLTANALNVGVLSLIVQAVQCKWNNLLGNFGSLNLTGTKELVAGN